MLLHPRFSCTVLRKGVSLMSLRKFDKNISSSGPDLLSIHHNMFTFRRAKSLYAPTPDYHFGPKAKLIKNGENMYLTEAMIGSGRLSWNKQPMSVLIVKKIFDGELMEPFKRITKWLQESKNMLVYVESSVLDEEELTDDPSYTSTLLKLCTFKEGNDLTDRIDFIICLGGDGTLLYASSLFQQSVPPVIAFHLGSLGFLTSHAYSMFESSIEKVMEGNVMLTLRSRLQCKIVSYNKKKDKPPSLKQTETTPSSDSVLIPHRSSDPPIEKIFQQLSTNGRRVEGSKLQTIISKTETQTQTQTRVEGRTETETHLVLNEVAIDRGSSSNLCNLEMYIDGRHVTTVQGDGLIISTPTGSTAYAVAAGAAMVHPSVPSILITPVCPHSLSFRPIVIPAGVELKIEVSPDARASVWASFDGRSRQEIKQGESVTVRTSIYPVPCVCRTDQINDWFDSLVECLQWNVRLKQLPLRTPRKKHPPSPAL